MPSHEDIVGNKTRDWLARKKGQSVYYDPEHLAQYLGAIPKGAKDPLGKDLKKLYY